MNKILKNLNFGFTSLPVTITFPVSHWHHMDDWYYITLAVSHWCHMDDCVLYYPSVSYLCHMDDCVLCYPCSKWLKSHGWLCIVLPLQKAIEITRMIEGILQDKCHTKTLSPSQNRRFREIQLPDGKPSIEYEKRNYFFMWHSASY